MKKENSRDYQKEHKHYNNPQDCIPAEPKRAVRTVMINRITSIQVFLFFSIHILVLI